jgi:hypothetical protein
MALEIFAPILPLQLDNRNVGDIVRAIQTRMFIESDGTLNDFTPASPLSAISEGQGFAQAELLYYLNTLPEAVTLQWLRSLGVQRKLGSRALAEVTFYKVPGYSRPVTIPGGTRVFARSGQSYILLDQVQIVDQSAVGTVQSERWGEVYNVAQDEITRIERNFLGLDFITNLEPASGGTDLETVDQMKIRAFELLGRRNLTSREDYRSEVRAIAPEASIVEVLPYEERFQDDVENNRGIFIVAGGEDGSPLTTATQSVLLTSFRDRTPIDVKLFLTPPTILPVEVVVSISWNPRITTTFSDTLASQVNDLLKGIFSPSSLGLGTNVSYTDVSRQVLALDFVQDIPILDLKEMALDPEITGNTDGVCGRFLGTEDEETLTCSYTYNQFVDRVSASSLICPNSTSAFRLYRSIVSLTSVIDSTTITYTYDNLYDIV